MRIRFRKHHVYKSALCIETGCLQTEDILKRADRDVDDNREFITIHKKLLYPQQKKKSVLMKYSISIVTYFISPFS